jgi:hypothetical protein
MNSREGGTAPRLTVIRSGTQDDRVGLLDILFPTVLGEAEIRVLSGSSSGLRLRVSFILKTFKLAKKNEFAAAHVAGLNGEPLQFERGGSRTLSVVLSFDGRASNTDARVLTARVTALMNVDRDTSAPPVLSFDWGSTSLQCVLESAVEEFRSLCPNGRPSRGLLRVVFRESRTLEQLQRDLDRE